MDVIKEWEFLITENLQALPSYQDQSLHQTRFAAPSPPLLPNLPPASIIQILKMKFISYLSFHPLLFCYG